MELEENKFSGQNLEIQKWKEIKNHLGTKLKLI